MLFNDRYRICCRFDETHLDKDIGGHWVDTPKYTKPMPPSTPEKVKEREVYHSMWMAAPLSCRRQLWAASPEPVIKKSKHE